MPHPLGDELTELHVHLGGAVDPAAMWGIAHEQGIRLPTKDYWEFVDLITVRKQTKKSFEDYLALYHWTELIQSSPLAVEQSVFQVVGGAYRKANITTLELRYNPMKRNRGGERDLDHIIMASIRGLDRALLEYPVKCGLIFCLDRTFNYALNEIILEKAIAYRRRGVVGVDIAGGHNADFRYRDYAPLFKKARKAGLGLTIHAGEDEGPESVDEVIRYLEPDRIGQGGHAAEGAAGGPARPRSCTGTARDDAASGVLAALPHLPRRGRRRDRRVSHRRVRPQHRRGGHLRRRRVRPHPGRRRPARWPPWRDPLLARATGRRRQEPLELTTAAR